MPHGWAGDRTDKPQKWRFSGGKFQKCALQLWAKLRIRVSLSPCPTVAQAARQSRCASTGGRQGEGRGGGGRHAAAPDGHCGRRRPGPSQNAQGDGAKTEAAHACGQAGREARVEKTEGRLPRDCDLGAGPERISWQQLQSAK